MCGIVGVLSISAPIEGSVIERMKGSIAHRGPDAHGTYIHPSQTLALGHVRLSVLDLSSAANQPFYSNSGRYVITYNGEIYNFKELRNELETDYGVHFKTQSDTEVIVEGFAIWGEKIAHKLSGMFAFAVVDQNTKKLHLFRDRIGKKPLYYFKSNDLFAFGSEIKSLLQHPAIRAGREINKAVISSFLHLGYIPEPNTIYTNIYKFPSGHFGSIDAGLKLDMQSYWCIQDKLNLPRIDNKIQAKEHLQALLKQSVQSRLISDVPLGIFLSGGTDSSLVTAIASTCATEPMKTFSIGFKETKFDESKFARRVATHLKTDHTEYILEEKEAAQLLETYLRHFDEPFADTSAIPTMLVSKLARHDVKVVLTGDGGDELFQGYGSYTWANRLHNPFWKILNVPLSVILQSSNKSRWQRTAKLLKSPRIGGTRSHIFSQEQYFFTQNEIRTLLLKQESDFSPFIYDESWTDNKKLSAGEKQALFDLQYYLKDDLLVKVDRASMYYGVECRSPLLDYEIVEYASSINYSMKKRKGKTKWLLKEILYEFLPRELVDRPKWGFSVPLIKWLKQDLRYLIHDFLSDQVIDEIGLFNKTYIQKLKTEFFGGKEYLYNRLWVIIVLHKWLKENL